MVCDISRKHDLPIVKPARMIPDNAEYRAKTLHLTPKGMEMQARGLAGAMPAAITDRPSTAEGNVDAGSADTPLPR